jgi:hypothetical protein
LKDKAQYDRRDVSETEARAALRRARTMVQIAETALAES